MHKYFLERIENISHDLPPPTWPFHEQSRLLAGFVAAQHHCALSLDRFSSPHRFLHYSALHFRSAPLSLWCGARRCAPPPTLHRTWLLPADPFVSLRNLILSCLKRIRAIPGNQGSFREVGDSPSLVLEAFRIISERSWNPPDSSCNSRITNGSEGSFQLSPGSIPDHSCKFLEFPRSFLDVQEHSGKLRRIPDYS